MKKSINKWQSTLNVWQMNVPPARPSASEIAMYTKHLRRLQKELKRKIKMLVLGSTIEFRDWGYEEGMDITVIDYSRDNYDSLSLFRQHQKTMERFIEKNWQEMNFREEFDLIVGDHAIGVMKKENLSLLMQNIARALDKNGIFITKQYFKNESSKNDLEKIIKRHYQKFSGMNILMTSMNDIIAHEADASGYFSFKKTLVKIKNLYKKGILKQEDYRKFISLGWDKVAYDLFVPRRKEWEVLIKPYFKIRSIEESGDIYSSKLPIYILNKK